MLEIVLISIIIINLVAILIASGVILYVAIKTRQMRLKMEKETPNVSD